MLLDEDSSVLLLMRCYCISGVGVCGRMWIGQNILSLYMCMISYSVSSCVVHVKYCNHLLAADMARVACRGLWCACCWKNDRDGSP